MPGFPTATGTIHYEVYATQEGEAPTLTLLHNFMSSGRSAWGRLIPALATHFRVLLPDLPGHGRSVGFPADFNHREMARQIADLMQAEGAEQGFVAGVSSGGMVALQMLVHGMVQPRAAALISTTYSNAPAVLGPHVRLRPATFRANGRWLEATARLHDPHQGEGYFDNVLLPGFRRLNPENTVDFRPADLARIACPILIVHGEEDEFFAPEIPRRMAAHIPQAELHLIPGQSHALIFRRPRVVQDILFDWLKGQR